MRGEATDPNVDAPAANDDASRTAVVLELAEVLSSRKFDATIVFAAFVGEEQGLLGSGHFAEGARAANRIIEAMITNDIVGNTEGGDGRRDNRTIRVFSEGLPDSPLGVRLRAVGGENDSPSRQLARYIRETADAYTPEFRARMVFRADRYGRGGDHQPFLRRGYAAVRFTEPAENYAQQHQDVRTVNGVAYGDVVSGVDFPYVAAVARLNAAVVASLALAPPPPSDPTIVARGMEYDTTLSWTATSVPDLAGYEVVWRDSTAPDWEHARPVGNVTRATLKGLSKDDRHFGVRAVDRDGHRSPVAFPLPPARLPR
jgi:Zn-dependent M28 family amino/carboxypeptidase